MIWLEKFCSWSDERNAYIVDGAGMDDHGRVVGQIEDVIEECISDGDLSDTFDLWIEDIDRQMSEG